MQSYKALPIFAGVACCLVLDAHGFVALSNNLSPTKLPTSSGKTHVSSINARRGYHNPSHTSRPYDTRMMAGGKKKRRRKENTSSAGKGSSDSSAVSNTPKPSQAKATRQVVEISYTPKDDDSKKEGDVVVGGAGQLGDVLEGDRGIEALFSDDWSGMPANDGMIKSDVALPELSTFKSSKRAESTLEQREKKTAVGLMIGKQKNDKNNDDAVPNISGYESKLPPLVDREEERLARSAAERFEEGPVVKALKTATWFSICSLVLWEVYINSPLFHTPEAPPGI